MPFIAIDLGSSFIKGAVLDLDTRTFSHVQRVPFPAPIPGLPTLRYEVDPHQVVAATRELISLLLSAEPNCDGLVLCSQMHGVILLDAQGVPVSNMVTWRDQRALEPHPSGEGTIFDHLARRVSAQDRSVLGNELRPGLPISSLFWFAEMGRLPAGDVIPAPISDFVLAQLCGIGPVCEPTNAAALGTLNLVTGDWHMPLLEQLGLGGLRWPPVLNIRQSIGTLHMDEHALTCYPSVGDQQCALVGAALAQGELSLNIATGSQVCLLRPDLTFGDFQTRPFFDSGWLSTITHIPAGRSLELLVTLLCEIAENQGVHVPKPWEYIANAVEVTPTTDLQIDLAFFASSLGNRGSLSNIHERNLSVGHVFRAAFERMATTYVACAQRLSREGDWQRLVFSGGVAQHLVALRETIAQRFGASYRVCVTPEDTLQGLLTLALVCNGRVPSVAQAIAEFRDSGAQP